MKAFAFTFFCFFMNSAHAQEVVVETPKVVEKSAPVYSMPAPIEVDVPYYQPRERVEKIYTVIKDSEFFFEINPLRMSGGSSDFESNHDAVNGPELEMDMSDFNFKLMPLSFKFGFENTNWGSFAEVLIQDSTQHSELVVFSKLGAHKLGAGFSLNMTESELKAKSNATTIVKEKIESTELCAYLYASFKLVDNETLSLEQWTKFGGGYEKVQSDGVKVKGVFMTINPALDLMFKINKKLEIGSGIEISYTRMAGDIEVSSSRSFNGIGNSFEYELNLIKTRFIF